MKVAVINNYLGNIQSVCNALDNLKVNYILTNKKEISNCSYSVPELIFSKSYRKFK